MAKLHWLYFYAQSSRRTSEIYKDRDTLRYYQRQILDDQLGIVRWVTVQRDLYGFTPCAPLPDNTTMIVLDNKKPKTELFRETTRHDTLYEYGVADKQAPFAWEE